MKKFVLYLLLFCAILPVAGQNIYPGYIDGQIYVKFSPSALKSINKSNPRELPLSQFVQLRPMFQKYGVTRANIPFYQASDDEILPYVLKFHFAKASQVQTFIAELENIDGIEYAEKVSLNKVDATPNDFSISSASVHLTQINAQNAWNVFNGNSNITVAIVDNAIMWTHADLVANTYTNTGEIAGNSIDDDGNGYIDDVNGFDVGDFDNNPLPPLTSWDHGTHCAGIAAARTDNAIGVASIGWNIKMIPVKAESSTGSATNVTYGYEGIIYAVKARARIISCSWGNQNGGSFTEQSVVNYAWVRGCIIMASAGNTGNSTPNNPGAYNNVYCVAAVNPSDVKSGYSNFGSWIDICAPGDNILSTVPYSGSPAYVAYPGTSMATPMVAGLAALMLSKSPNMTRTDVLNCISSTAVNIYTLSGNSALTGSLGAGRIEAYQAMLCAATFSALPPVANFYAFPPYTCPNTAIAFTDSSLYAPTSWNWTFQGGSPATSTLTNPTVSWTTAGMYSVALTVSNTLGSSAKTKLSYITVAGAGPLPFFEGFENAQFLPAGWYPNNIGNDHVYWERKAGIGGFGTSTACAIFDNYTYVAANDRDEMRSPKFNFSNVVNASLKFDVAYARFDANYSDTLEVKLSTNCGQTWTNIYLKGGSTLATASDASIQFTPTTSQWRVETVNINTITAGQGNVMFSFINRGHYGQPIHLDNINLFFPTPTLAVSSPSSICTGATLNFSNTSTGSSGYVWSMPGASPPASTATNPAVSYSAAGIYTVTLNGVNGTSTVSLTRTVNVITQPTVTATSGSICSGGSFSIMATGASSFAWNIGPTGPELVVSPLVTSTFSVIGTNGGICSASASATVTVVATPTLSVPSQTICPGGSATITASGASTYSWNTGATTSSIVLTPTANSTYTVAGFNSNCVGSRTTALVLGPPLPVTIGVNPTSMCAGASATLTATGATNYTWTGSATGSAQIVNPTSTTAYSVFGTAGSCTGSAFATVTIAPTPTVNISLSPAGPYCSGNPLSLTAGGATKYFWNTGDTTSTAIVNPSATTVYSVIGSNLGCSKMQTVQVVIVGTGLNVGLSSSANTLCAGSSATLTANGAASFTWSTFSNATFIVVSPGVTTTYTVTGKNGTCFGSAVQTLTVHALPLSAISTTNSSCSNACTGIASALSSGGTPPYTYSLSGNSCSVLPCSNLCQSLYTLYTTDAQGCRNASFFSIGNSVALAATLSHTNSGCVSCNNGAIGALASAGNPPYTYSWAPSGGTNPTATGLAPGCYTVHIVDAGGCSLSLNDCISFDVGIAESAVNGSPGIYPNPSHNSFFITSPGVFEYALYDALGQLVSQAKELTGTVEVRTALFAKGIYFIAVKTMNENFIRKVVLE